MAIQTKRNAGELIVEVSGRIDSVTSEDLSSVLEQEITDDITSLSIDMTEVSFITSKGLRVLVATHRKLNGKEITLIGANETVLEVLRLSSLLKLFTIK